MNWTMIRLVAGRELRMRVRSRAYVIATLLLMAAVAAIIILTAVLRDDDDERTLDVGVVDPSPALEAALVASGRSLGTEVTVTALTDQADAERAVRDDDVD